MNRFTRYTATALTALACAGTGALHADPPHDPAAANPRPPGRP